MLAMVRPRRTTSRHTVRSSTSVGTGLATSASGVAMKDMSHIRNWCPKGTPYSECASKAPVWRTDSISSSGSW